MKHDFSSGTRVCQRCGQSGYLIDECPTNANNANVVLDSIFSLIKETPPPDTIIVEPRLLEITKLQLEIIELKQKIKTLKKKNKKLRTSNGEK